MQTFMVSPAVQESQIGAAISRKSVYQIGQTAVGMGSFTVLAFISGILIARGLGPAGQGRFQLLMSVAFVSVLIGKMGLDEALAYLIPQYNATNARKLMALITYSLGLTLTISIALGLLFYLTSYYLGRYIFTLPGFDRDLTILLYLLPALMLMYMTISVLRGLGRADLRAYVYYYGVGLLFLIVVTIFFVSGLNSTQAYLARIGSYAVGGLLALVLIWRLVPAGTWQLGFREIRSLHAFAGVLVFVGLFQYAVDQPLIDLVIVGRVASPEAVGVYSVAARISGLVAITANAFCIVLAPSLAHARAQNNSNEMASQYLRASEWMARVTLFSGLSLLLLRNEILSLFGQDYRSGSSLLAILLVGQIGAGLLGLNTPLLLASGYAWAELLITCLCAIVMILGGIVLGQHYGSVGVAVATTAVTIILALARRTVCRWFCGIGGGRDVLKVILMGIGSLIPALLVQKLVTESSPLNALLALGVFSCAFWGYNIRVVTTSLSQRVLNQTK